MTRACERLVLSGAARMSDAWPIPGPGAAPLSWIGPALVPGVAALDEPVRDHGLVRTVLNRPGGVLRLEAPAPVAPGEQLALAFNGAAPAAVAPPAARDFEPAPEPPPPAPATLSYSALSGYAACPYRFFLQRRLGLPEVPAPAHLRDTDGGSLELRLRGTLVHVLLEDLDLRPGAPLPTDAAIRAAAQAHEAALGDDDVADLRGLVGAFASSALRERLARARRVRREHPFAVALEGGPLLNGFVDVLAEEDGGGALIVDYKSDHVGDADLEALVEGAYATQRRIYALAALRAGAPTVEVAHLFLERPGEPAVARYAAGDADALEGDLRARAAPLVAGAFPVAALPHRGLCATCPGRDGLCSYPPALTDRAP
jgi:ATP-dependent helicase/nuclease subunit A